MATSRSRSLHERGLPGACGSHTGGQSALFRGRPGSTSNVDRVADGARGANRILDVGVPLYRSAPHGKR